MYIVLCTAQFPVEVTVDFLQSTEAQGISKLLQELILEEIKKKCMQISKEIFSGELHPDSYQELQHLNRVYEFAGNLSHMEDQEIVTILTTAGIVKEESFQEYKLCNPDLGYRIVDVVHYFRLFR